MDVNQGALRDTRCEVLHGFRFWSAADGARRFLLTLTSPRGTRPCYEDVSATTRLRSDTGNQTQTARVRSRLPQPSKTPCADAAINR